MIPTLAAELARAAEDTPDGVFVCTREARLSYAEARDTALELAAGLQAHGVGRGSTVALVMGNSTDQVALWLALNALGALHVPLNPALTGDHLRHALGIARPDLIVADADLLAGNAVLGAVGATSLVDLHDADPRDADPRDVRSADKSAAWWRLVDDGSDDDLAVATLLLTSGTSGRSKACELSHRYLLRQGQIHARQLAIDSGDVLYCPFPLFHIDAATLTVVAALVTRATAALAPRFSASGFWDDVRYFDTTVFNFMGATLTILWKQPPTDRDRDHRVRVAWGVPMPPWQPDFEERFAVSLRQVYGLTDGGVPVYDPLDGALQRGGRAGRVIEDFEVRIDASRRRPGDPEGVGEILVRGREPGLTMNAYHGDPTATAQTVVDGWVRTGDLGHLDDEQYLAFHGRLSDSIRRRGENIAAAEVEDMLSSHPMVREASAVGVPSELTEEDVLVWVVLQSGAEVTAEELRQHCLANGPAFMAPRYIRLVPELPRTPTEKVEKYKIRDLGLTADVWDCERQPETPAGP